MNLYQRSLLYHSTGRKGKIEILVRDPRFTEHLTDEMDIEEIVSVNKILENTEWVHECTTKANLVAVVSNGSAVLGLGNIGPSAGKPVMEGKGVLFKKFADLDVFDIELKAPTAKDVIQVCQWLEPTFGGINLEDIKAPECFMIEEELKKTLKIPVFHDDQHGTAIICSAAFLNALEIVGKKIESVQCVFIGGGAACIASAQMFLQLGVPRHHLMMTDLDGVIYEGRQVSMNPYKQRFARMTSLRTLAEVMHGADVVVGLSAHGVLTAPMIQSMNRDPIIFAMANPEPEILPEEVFSVRKDAIMATGRSDYPNQVNNLLCFPFLFRGALDVRATQINDAMKLAAVRALADLAKAPVAEHVIQAYGGKSMSFGRDYLIPKPFDQRALLWIAPQVAAAAMDSGVARQKIDLKGYQESLESLLGSTYTVMHWFKRRLKDERSQKPLPRFVFPEGEHECILKAASILFESQVLQPILLGNPEKIQAIMYQLDLKEFFPSMRIINPEMSDQSKRYANLLFQRRQRKGMTPQQVHEYVFQKNYYGSLMLEAQDADGMLCGVTQSYSETLRPAIQSVGVQEGSCLVGVYLLILKKGILWFADTTVNIEPTVEELSRIGIQTYEFASQFMLEQPKMAMVSFSNFKSSTHPLADRVRLATQLIKEKRPSFNVDGEMQIDTALNSNLSEIHFPFNQVPGNANIFIFPDLQSANIAYQLMGTLAHAEKIGPILLGMKKPIYILAQNSSVTEVVHAGILATMDAYSQVRRK